MSKKAQQVNNDASFGIQLGTYLKEYALTGEVAEKIISKFQPMILKKSDVFCKKGQVSDRLGVLIEGFLYAYYETSNAKEVVSRFFYHPDNFIVSNFESFSLRKPSNETIKALEKSLLQCISYNDLQQLYDEIPQMNFISRQFAEQNYIRALQRIHTLQALNAKERVEKLFKEQRMLFQKVQIQHLSSYLGMNRNLISKFQREM